MPSEDYTERARDERDDIFDADEDRDLVDGADQDMHEDSTAEPEGGAVTFASLGLPEEILEAVTDMGFRVPTPIQAAAIPPLLELRDVVGIAQTGTGKTAAFGPRPGTHPRACHAERPGDRGLCGAHSPP